MITPLDLEFFGKQAAREYTENGVGLNESIKKLANEHGLNKAQTDRVIETANTETYIEIANKTPGSEKYVTFEVAQRQKTASSINQPLIDDYSLPPEKHNRVKTAEANVSTSEEKLASLYQVLAEEAIKRQHVSDWLSKYAEELHILWNREAEVLRQHVKQAALYGTPYDYIAAAMKTASPNATTRVLTRKFREEFSNVHYARHVNLEKQAAKRAIINEEHPIIESLYKLATYEKLLARVGIALQNNNDQLKKAAGVLSASGKLVGEVAKAVGKDVGKIARGAKTHPAIAGAAVLTAGTFTVGKNVGKAQNTKDMSALHLNYTPNSHNISRN